MEKIALITDSACDIDPCIVNRFNIKILPFKIIYKNKEYTDKVDITPKEIYDNMKNEIPKTSLPSMKDIEQVYEELDKNNYTHVIAVVISSGLSGTYNSVKIISEKYRNITTYICDTKSTSIVQGIILEECGKLIEKGESFSEIVNTIPEIKSRIHFFFVFGTLEYAVKGGRIGRIAGTVGELLDIKPIVGFDDNYGQCFTYDKIRGRRRSLNRLVDIGKEILSKNKCDIYIVHGNADEDAKKVYEMLSQVPNAGNIHMIGQISAVVGVYSGPGTVGVCYKECSKKL